MAFRLARCTRIMMLMVPVWPVVSQLTASIPLSSRCRSQCGGLGPGDITALETVAAMTSPGW